MMVQKSHARHPHSKDGDPQGMTPGQMHEMDDIAEQLGNDKDEDDDDDDDLFKFSPPVHFNEAHSPGFAPPRTATAEASTKPPSSALSRIKTAVSGKQLIGGRLGTSDAQRVVREYHQKQKEQENAEEAASSSKRLTPPSTIYDQHAGTNAPAEKRRQPYAYPGSPVYHTSAYVPSHSVHDISPTRLHTPVIELADRMRQASTMTMSYPPEYDFKHDADRRSVASGSGAAFPSGGAETGLKKRHPGSGRENDERKGYLGGRRKSTASTVASGLSRSRSGLPVSHQHHQSSQQHLTEGRHDYWINESDEYVPGDSTNRLDTGMSGLRAPVGGPVMNEGHGNEHDFIDPDKLSSYSAFELEDEEDSPYPEVRASVSNIDDPEMPCLTFRAWVIGLSLVVVGSGFNLFFNIRYPAPLFTPITVQVVSYPIGKMLAYLLPVTIFRPSKLAQRLSFGIIPSEFSLNPGPFNIKEHTVIVIMASISMSPSYALMFTLTLDKFYRIPQGVGFDFLTLLATNAIGFSFAGICRRYLVWPASLVWPQNLVTCTLFNTFHAEDDDGSDGSLTRYRYFLYVLAGAFCWFFLPGFIFTALSAFSFICWAAPENRVVNQLFGVSTGLGMSILTFDWSQISYTGSPLIVPWWAEVNIFVGFVVLYWFLTPILYYKNVSHYCLREHIRIC